MSKRLKPREIARIRELRDSGFTYADIADDVGRTIATVTNVCLGRTGTQVTARRVADLPVLRSEEQERREAAAMLRRDERDALHTARIGKLLEFFGQEAAEPPAFFTAAQLANAMDVHATAAGRMIQGLFPGLTPTPRKGYPTGPIYARLDAMLEELGNG